SYFAYTDHLVKLFVCHIYAGKILAEESSESSMKQSWEFLISKYYYQYSFKNFYATVIQRAYRNYKKRPETTQ
ncbi:6754_t:CDS:2, partial [Rhizophagus irregularis]